MSVRDDERAVRDSYERIPYPSGSEHHTHPSHLGAMAILRGMHPAPPAQCRVLELGCADGGNLIPMAFELRDSRFVGVDLSPRQIDTGRAFATDLGLTNVDLRAMSILDVDESFGVFDYIVCHGVYSWVPPAVQEKILTVCRKNLAPNGIAYVSYNTYPGWHLRRLVREMLLFHTRAIDDLEEQVASAYDFIRFLAETAGHGQDVHSALLRDTQQHFEEFTSRPSYVAHEYLEATNAPLYFHEFAGRAARHDLQLVAEAEPGVAGVASLPPPIVARLREWTSDEVALEQYTDFIVNRTFRRSLLTHREVVIDRTPDLARLEGLFASTAAKPVSPDPDLGPYASESFKTERGQAFSSDHPLAKRVLVALASIWPRQMPVAELRSGAGAGADLADLLVSLHASGVVELDAVPRQCVSRVSERPRVSELARRQAEAGLLVTSQRRRVLKLDDPVARFLVRHLDGTRDRTALLRLLDREAAARRLDVSVDGQSTVDPRRLPMVLEAVLDHQLRKMVEHAMLVE